MRSKDMHKCDIIIEWQDLGCLVYAVRQMLIELDGFDHSLFADDIQKAHLHLERLKDALNGRRDELGDAINPIFEAWSNDELA